MSDYPTIVYRGRVFSVEQDSFRLPDGREVRADIIRHRPSVVLLPMQSDGRVVLIKQYRHALKRDMWELPAGSVDAGEAAEAAAARECEEEIGLVPASVERLGSFYPVPGYCDEEMIFFRVSDLKPPAADSTHKPDEDEDIESRPTTVAEARAMVARGEIVDRDLYALTLI